VALLALCPIVVVAAGGSAWFGLGASLAYHLVGCFVLFRETDRVTTLLRSTLSD
jgi:hypothetical protein